MPTTVRFRPVVLVATSATVLAVAAGVVVADGGAGATPVASEARGSLSIAGASDRAALTAAEQDRELATTRSTERVPLAEETPQRPAKRLWTTSKVDLRTQPGEKAKVVRTVKSITQVQTTGRRDGRFAEVVDDGVTRWVTAKYLSAEKPEPPEPKTGTGAGISGAPCPDGSSIESALQPGAVKVYRAVCAAFPELSAYGGQDGHGEHVNGEAIDFMVPDSATGERVKDYLYANHAAFDLFDIIWAQSIWTIERSGEGFRGMSDRGSATANHFDHVHIKIN